MLRLLLSLSLFPLLFNTVVVVIVHGSSSTYQLHGSGTTNPSRCYWTILELLQEQAIVPLHTTYRGIGSTNGMTEFVYPLLNASTTSTTTIIDTTIYPIYFGSGDIPITTELYEQVMTATNNNSNSDSSGNTTSSIIQIPVLAGTVSFFHSVPNITNLNLTACILSQIYLQQITSWDNEQIRAINPELSSILTTTDVSQPITVIVRSEGSSSTHAATNYMHTACTDETLTLPLNLTGELPEWSAPSSSTFQNCSGSAGVTKCIVETPGSIGYIDTGHGLDAGLFEVRLRTKTSDTYFHSQQGAPIGDAITNDLLPPNPTDDFGAVSFLNAGDDTGDSDNQTWPLILMTYIYVRTDIASFIPDPVEQALLIAFLRTFFNSDYIDVCKELYGFTVMNDIIDMKAYGEYAISLVEANLASTAPDFIFESKTNVIGGAGPYVFSSKRKEIIDVTLSDLSKTVTNIEMDVDSILSTDGAIIDTDTDSQSKILLLEREVEKLFAEVNLLREQVEGSGGGSSSTSDSLFANGDDSKSKQQLKAALVLSSLSFLFWGLWMMAYMIRFMKHSSSSSTTTLP